MSRPTSISVSKIDLDKITEIKKELGISNTSDIYKRAISLYYFLLMSQEDEGRIVLTADKDGKDMERIRIM